MSARVRKILACVAAFLCVIGLIVGVASRYYSIDYLGVVEVIWDEIRGRKFTCVELPGEEWRMIPKCGGGRENNWGYPREENDEHNNETPTIEGPPGRGEGYDGDSV